MHIHILGICGTFMGGIAAMAKTMGYRVTGSDQNVYPPMSTQLEHLNIELNQGWDPIILERDKPDLVLVGNSMSRGNPMIEALLESDIPFQSAPQWLQENILRKQWVIAVAGTHGKTTTTSMITWILEKAGLNPGFLIGGKPAQFDVSARVGAGKIFVIEADEYDTAFFDKRSKFVHYWPKTCVLNNLEFDHADIFDSIEDIQKQFHHLVREVPMSGLVIHPYGSRAIDEVLEKGCWALTEDVGAKGIWGYQAIQEDLSQWELLFRGHSRGTMHWDLFGSHQVQNAISAIAACRHVGVDIAVALEAMSSFKLPKRRMESLGTFQKITLYDDFAHHPTAIALTIASLKARVKEGRVGVILDLRSNTMKQGIHQDTLADSLSEADIVAVYQSPDIQWPVQEILKSKKQIQVFKSTAQIVDWFKIQSQPGDHWVVMSNGGFEGIHQKLLDVMRNAPKLNQSP